MRRLRRGKTARVGAHTQGMLADYRPAALNAPVELSVFLGVDRVQPPGDHSNGAPTAFQRGPVGHAVNAQGQAADHRDSRRGQVSTEYGGRLSSVGSRVSGPHYGYRALILGPYLSNVIQHRGRVGNLLQPRRIIVAVPVGGGNARPSQRVHTVVGVQSLAARNYFKSGAGIQPGVPQLGKSGPPGVFQIARNMTPSGGTEPPPVGESRSMPPSI